MNKNFTPKSNTIHWIFRSQKKKSSGWAGYLQEAVSAAQEVTSLHDSICGEDQLILAECRLIWARVNRLGGCEGRQRGRVMWLLGVKSSVKLLTLTATEATPTITTSWKTNRPLDWCVYPRLLRSVKLICHLLPNAKLDHLLQMDKHQWHFPKMAFQIKYFSSFFFFFLNLKLGNFF